MTTKKYRNNYKNMHPNTAQHVGREVVLATFSNSNAENVNRRLKAAGVKNPDGTNVVFTDSHLQQMKTSLASMIEMVQDKAPHRFNEALDLVINMHTGGSYGPWYRRWYVPYALETGAPLWVPSDEAHAIVEQLKSKAA
jgi:hypothetical protein